MRFIVMFATAVCVLFLIKLRWPKKKNLLKLRLSLREIFEGGNVLSPTKLNSHRNVSKTLTALTFTME